MGVSTQSSSFFELQSGKVAEKIPIVPAGGIQQNKKGVTRYGQTIPDGRKSFLIKLIINHQNPQCNSFSVKILTMIRF